MPDVFLQNFNADFNNDSHVWRASEDFLIQLRKVSDNTPQVIFNSAERLTIARSSLFQSVTPYCNLIVGAQTIADKSIEGVIEVIRVPITIQCVFKVGARNSDGATIDLQGWCLWLQERIEQYLQPQDSGFTNGLVKTVPWIWNWTSGAPDKGLVQRTITELGTVGGKPLSGSAYALNLTYNIDVWPTHPLT
jgi:hypothetical protein